MVVFAEARIISINGETGVYITENNKLVNELFQLSPLSNWNPKLSDRIINSLDINIAKV